MNIILNIFVIQVTIRLVQGYTTVYQKTFDTQSSCFAGDTYIPSIIYQQNAAAPIDCDIQCTNPQTSNPQAMLVIGPNETGINFTISLASISEPFSIVGVEIVYTTSADAKLEIDLNGWTTQQFNSPKQSKYIDNYNTFSCSPYQSQFYSSNIIYSQVSSFNGDLLIKFNKITSNPSSSKIGIRSIKVWTNCKLGCSTCSDSTTCTSCLIPYKPYKEPDWANGQVFCLHNYGCEEASPGCNLCYYDGVSKYFCGLCQTQYSQQIYGYCVSNTCPSNQMFFDNKCVNKGNNCVVYNKNTNTVSDCDLTKIDINNYQCPEDKVTTIFEYNNYSQFICNCYFYGGYDCDQCLTKGSCSQCSSMKYYDSVNNICKYFTCPDGSYATRTLQCLSCPSGCKKCTTTTSCTQCTIPGYYFNGVQCVVSPISNCTTYNPNGSTCSQCFDGYQLQNSNTSCVKSCTITNCDVCYSNGTNFCSKCLPSYQLNSTNNSCVHCTTMNCLTCQQNLNKCDSCLPGNYYFISSNQTCLSCQVSNCTTCQPNDYTKCQLCNAPYSLQVSTSTCTGCETPHCGGIGKCLKNDSTVCTTCSSGYTLSSTNQACNLCNVTDCDECDPNDPNKCIRCASRYYIKSSNFSCGFCNIQYCNSCSESNLTVCTQCYSYKVWNQSQLKCLDCTPNCKICSNTSATECSVCNTGYVLNPTNNSCIPQCQVSNCSSCVSNSTSQCQICNNGFYVNSTTFQCEICQVQNCDICSITSQYQCNYCAVGYLKSGGGTSCQLCNVNNCLQCSNNNPNICTSCENGLLPNPTTGNCEFCQVSGCKTCSNSSSLICSTCNDNFILNNGQCDCNLQYCSQCDYSINGKCLQCNNNAFIDQNNTCHPICQVNNCQQCSNNNPNICAQCSNNFLLNPNTGGCELCQVNNCSLCKNNNPNFCAQCSNNFLLNPNSGICELCQVIGCKTCSNQSSLECSICNDNFILNNTGKCDCNLQQCTQCDNNIIGKCLQCNNQTILDANFNCQLKCSVNNCKECSPNDQNVCLACQEQYYLDLENQCQLKNFNEEKKINNFRFDQKLKDTGVELTLVFNEKLNVVPKLSNSILKVEISDYTNFDYNVTQVTNENIIMNLLFTETVKLSTVKVTLTNQQFVSLNLIEKNVREEELEPYIKLNQSQKDAIAASSSVSNSVSMTIISSFLPLAIFGHFYVLVNTIDYTSFLYYLLFINIRHPENVVTFYGTFKNFQFPFIPNIFQYMIPDDYVLESPKKFMDMETDAYFLRNGGQSITICLMIVSMYIGARILQKLPIMFLKRYLDRAIKETWHYGAFFDMLCTVYIYLLVSSLVQFLNFDFNNNTENCVLNYTLHIITTFLGITIPFAMFSFMYKLKNLKSNKDMQTKISTIVGGLNLYDETQQTPVQPIQSEMDNYAKINLQPPQIQQKLKDYEQQQNKIVDQNDFLSFKINSFQNIKLQKNENLNQKDTLQSEKNINQNDLYETSEKLNVQSNRNSIVMKESFNNLQTRRRSISNSSKFQSSEGILYRRDKQSKLKFITKKQSSDSIFPPDYFVKKKTLREKLQIKYSKQYNSLLYIRKLFFSMIIVYLYDHCYLQLVLISLLNIFISGFIFYIKPFEQNSENIKSGICEILLVFIHICLIFLIQDKKEQDEQVRMNAGWIIIAISLTIILWNFVIIMYQLLCFILQLLKRLILSILQTKNKVAPSPISKNNDIQNQNKDTSIKQDEQNQNQQPILNKQDSPQNLEYDENEKNIPSSNIFNLNNNSNQHHRKTSLFSSWNTLSINQKNSNTQGSTPSPEPQNSQQKRAVQKNSLFKRNSKTSKVQRIFNDDTTVVNSQQNIQNDSKLNEPEYDTPQNQTRVKSRTASQFQIIYDVQ